MELKTYGDILIAHLKKVATLSKSLVLNLNEDGISSTNISDDSATMSAINLTKKAFLKYSLDKPTKLGFVNSDLLLSLLGLFKEVAITTTETENSKAIKLSDAEKEVTINLADVEVIENEKEIPILDFANSDITLTLTKDTIDRIKSLLDYGDTAYLVANNNTLYLEIIEPTHKIKEKIASNVSSVLRLQFNAKILKNALNLLTTDKVSVKLKNDYPALFSEATEMQQTNIIVAPMVGEGEKA
jgi:DNA polymerase III sliding clamp (beta) subunit (PCNA family)